jgi:hypothetical protein
MGGGTMKRHVRRHEVVQPLDTSYKIIPLTQGQNALVDSEDYDWIMQWNWYAHWYENTKSFYAYRQYGRTQVSMHSEILKCGPYESDHRNHDTLDNRRNNLRICTHVQNMSNRRWGNSDGYKGIKFFPKLGKWMARIQFGNKRKYLGLYESAEAAARAYDMAAKELHGEFANLNFP